MRISEKAFLEPMFRSLEENGITYAVLRNAETLPDTTGGSDIDMQIAIGKMSDVTLCLGEVASQCGGRIMAKIDSPHFRQLQVMGRTQEGWWACCIDIFEGVFCRSVLPVVGDLLLRKRIKGANGIWQLDDERAMYLGFVKELLTNGVVSRRYIDGANRAVTLGRDDFLLSESLRKFTGRVLLGCGYNARVFRWVWLVSLAIRHPSYFLRNWGGFYISRLKRIVHPAGKMMVVMGTDGAGKSTVIDGILPMLKLLHHGNVTVKHLKPDLLPPLGRFRGVKNNPGHVCTNPHGSKPSGSVGSLVRISYLMCDYIIGYWLKVRVRMVKIPVGLWVFDRYAYDILIDQRRFRISLPKWAIRFFLFFAPRPDLVLCLGGDPKKVYVRKPETSLEEVRRQTIALEEFSEQTRRSVWVDTTCNAETSCESALRAIFDTL